jgi:hypothetical protein
MNAGFEFTFAGGMDNGLSNCSGLSAGMEPQESGI